MKRQWRRFKNNENAAMWYEVVKAHVSPGDALLQCYEDAWIVKIADSGCVMQTLPQRFPRDTLEEAKAYAEVMSKIGC